MRALGSWLRGWSLWQLSPAALWYLLGIELIAVFLTAFSFEFGSFDRAELARAALLLAMSVIYGEACDRIERLGRYLTTRGLVMNQNSVLCFAGVLTLPTQLAAGLVVGVYAHAVIRARRTRSGKPHRLAFTAATSVLATFAARGCYLLWGGSLVTLGPLEVLSLAATIAVYTVTNLLLLLVCLRLVNAPASWRSLLPRRHQVAYENSTLLLGSVAAVVVVHAVWLSPFILILIANLHRASLVTELQHTARSDHKTGLLNSGGWQLLAHQHIAQCAVTGTSASVLLIDLDHFKQVNDTYGHLAGDVVLKSVAEILARELRGYDAVGRYGGEEFIALLPGVDGEVATVIGDRVRQRISSASTEDLVPVTASVGIAAGPVVPGLALEDFIEAADAALYEAKRAGRDQVCLAPTVDRTPRILDNDRRGFPIFPPPRTTPPAGRDSAAGSQTAANR